MLNLVQTPLARSDIKGIWIYTNKNWGINQADSYVQELGIALHGLCKSPMIGISIEQIFKICRLFHYRRHLVIYSITETILIVQRVLHENMDITQHKI